MMAYMRVLAIVAITASLAGRAYAARPPVACDTLPNPLYLEVGDTQTQLMKALGRKLRDNTPKPITLVFTTNPSCTNLDHFYNHSARTTVNMQYVPSASEDPDWVQSSPTLLCTPPNPDGAGTPGIFNDIANSAIFTSACTNITTTPTTVHLETGPTQAYVLAVPKGSTQTAMTFEEAYFVFGFGTAGMISPWTDETQLFIRAATTSTALAWAAQIGVPAPKWKGQRQLGSTGSALVVQALEGTTGANIEKAVGILGSEVADAERAKLSILAWRAKGQWAAYYPDSTSSSRDKKNVRDGHYTVWSPTIWIDNIDAGGNPTKPDTRYVINLIAGHDVTPPPNFDANEVVARVGLVPLCAMHVTREFEGGPLTGFQSDTSCTCKFESIVDATSCDLCSDTCSGGKVCRGGYCEER
jgi:hypothetical protein